MSTICLYFRKSFYVFGSHPHFPMDPIGREGKSSEQCCGSTASLAALAIGSRTVHRKSVVGSGTERITVFKVTNTNVA